MLYDNQAYEDAKADYPSNRRYWSTRSKHPDCRDPEHPGCEKCDDAFPETDDFD